MTEICYRGEHKEIMGSDGVCLGILGNKAGSDLICEHNEYFGRWKFERDPVC